MAARFLSLGAAMAAVAQANPMHGNGTVTTTTEVVETLTTYCPGPTTLTYGDKTYTVTEATTLTITDCPCTLTHPVHPTTTYIAPPQDECAKKCGDEYNHCRTAPDANMSYCAAMYAKCLGYNPFEDGSLVTPTACSAKPTETMYTTEVVTAITTYCPAPTTLTHGNKTYTVTEPTTLTITDCPCTVSKPVEEPSHPAQPEPSHPGKPEQPGCNGSDCPEEPEQPEQPEQPEHPGCNGSDCPEQPEQPDCNGSDCPEQPEQPEQPTGCQGADCNGPPAVVTPGPSDVPASAGRVVPGALVALGAFALL